jgi:hypothetical protein
MVTTNCQELTGKGNCTVPLTGGTAQELQQNVFKHAQQDHGDIVKAMSPEDQTKMVKRIQEVYNQKAGAVSRS